MVGCGSGGVVGVSSESFEGGAGKRMGGLDGAESQDEVVDGKRILGGSFLVMELINKLQQLHHIENL